MFSDNWTGSKNGVSVCVKYWCVWCQSVCYILMCVVSVCVLNIDVCGVRVCVTYQRECMVSEKSTH